MKKIVFAVVVLATVLASCSLDGSDLAPVNDEPVISGDDSTFSLPNGVYIAGTSTDGNKTQTCYWKGRDKVELELGTGIIVKSISVSNGKVVVYDLSASLASYWVDGKRGKSPGTGIDDVIFDNDKVYGLDYSNRSVWVDGVQVKYTEKFSPSHIAVHNGKLYTTGWFYDEYSHIYYGYYVDNIRTDISSPESATKFYFNPNDITVSEDGKAYIVFRDSYIKKCWYYTDGQFFELEDYNNAIIKRITVSGGKVYLAGYYLEGLYWEGQIKKACYWVDGVRHDLPGSEATAIFVEE